MFCLAILDSSNYVFSLCRALEIKGHVFEVVSTPCKLAKSGCGYCLKFPCEFQNVVIENANILNTPVRELYCAHDMITKFKYEKLL
jgi:hypothetical protein